MYKILIITILFSFNGYANEVNFFEDNTSVLTEDNSEDNPSNPPILIGDSVPISDYQYVLLIVAVGISGIVLKNKNKKLIS